MDISGAGWRVLSGSCLDRLPELADNSIDAVVCDPPYELGFMGKKWDSSGIAFDLRVWVECLRVLKPGGHLLAFGGSRTWHRIAVAIEDAGFDIRDSIAWLYGSGFPKSLDVSKAIDKAAGVERETLTEVVTDIFGEHEQRKEKPAYGIGDNGAAFGGHAEGALARETAPATPEAQKWQGWGTALKPAFEPVIVARKPLIGTVAENVLTHGTGALNIDGTRIGTDSTQRQNIISNSFMTQEIGYGSKTQEPYSTGSIQGRWPSNVMLDEYTAGLVDEQSGERGAQGKASGPTLNGSSSSVARGRFHGVSDTPFYGDTGGASRFFYVAKASKRDRNEGLDGLEEKRESDRVRDDGVGGDNPRNRSNNAKVNFHPTVKPTDLMRQLVRLVTPPGGVVLDPFVGSGSTGKAAILEGFEFIGCELTDDYLPIIEGRLNHAVATVQQERADNEAREKETLF